MTQTVSANDRKRAVQKLFWSAWGSAFVGNFVGALTIGITIGVSVRAYAPEVPYGWLMRQFVVIGLAVIPPTIVGTLIAAHVKIQGRMRWFLEVRDPSPKELRRFVSLPRLVATANAVAWVLMFIAQMAYMVHVVDLPYRSWAMPKAAAIYAFGYLIATALAYLLMEGRFRPFLESLLPRDVRSWPRSMGVEQRLLAAWFTVAGAPLLLITFTFIGLSPTQRDLATPALRTTALVAAGVGLLIFVIAGRTIAGPLRRLQAAQRRVASGDLSVHVELEQSGEIGELEAGFNHMVDGLSTLAADNARLQDELRAQLEEVRASRVRIVEAADAERARIERNLHDGAQQRLLSLAFLLREVERKLDDESLPGVRERVQTSLKELDAAMNELRELARGIHPAILDEEGLGPALESLAERAAVPVELRTELPERLPTAVEVSAYFVVAEALTNAARYAEASKVTIEAIANDSVLRLRVSDDGKGGADPQSGTGLRGLSDRVAALGGELLVESERGQGTRVAAVIPCN
jgi:signal transduction histidine kinase